MKVFQISYTYCGKGGETTAIIVASTPEKATDILQNNNSCDVEVLGISQLYEVDYIENESI